MSFDTSRVTRKVACGDIMIHNKQRVYSTQSKNILGIYRCSLPLRSADAVGGAQVPLSSSHDPCWPRRVGRPRPPGPRLPFPWPIRRSAFYSRSNPIFTPSDIAFPTNSISEAMLLYTPSNSATHRKEMVARELRTENNAWEYGEYGKVKLLPSLFLWLFLPFFVSFASRFNELRYLDSAAFFYETSAQFEQIERTRFGDLFFFVASFFIRV